MPVDQQDRDDASSSSSSMLVTNTLLAIPDGPIQSTSKDLKTHTSSYIGGYPTFPITSIPESITCKICNNPIPLLTQVYCPLEDGENDRTLYVFACSQSACQRQDGSVRAFRASLRNDAYMADVDAKRAERERREKEEKDKAKINPFSIKSDAAGGAGLGNQLFGGGDLFGSGSSNSPFASPNPVPEVADLEINLDTRPSPTSFTPPLPAYQPPQYLSTFDEYLPDPDAESDDESDEDEVEVDEDAAASGGGASGEGAKAEDEVFERFIRRIGMAEGGEGHVLRYDFNSIPLPYSSKSALYKKLFPTGSEPVAGKYFPVTRPSHSAGAGAALQGDESETEASQTLSKLYNPSSIPTCPRCNAQRVFELQLVPSLISVLRPSMISTDGKVPKKKKSGGSGSERERLEELRRLAAGLGSEGMEWGSVLVFGCVGDCVGFGEEWVGVEWESLK